jgi:hypothetical protein
MHRSRDIIASAALKLLLVWRMPQPSHLAPQGAHGSRAGSGPVEQRPADDVVSQLSVAQQQVR